MHILIITLMENPLEADIEPQGDFDVYIKSLPPKAECKHMISTVVNLCTRPEVNCPFRGDDIYSFAHGEKKECKRPDVMRMRELLGVK